MLKYGFNKLELGHGFSLFFSIGFVRKADIAAVIADDSSLGYRRMSGVTGNIA